MLLFVGICVGLVGAFADEMRPLATDRPGRTESAISVDPGRFQIETDLLAETITKEADTKYIVNFMNLKYGLSDSTDIQLVIPTVSWHSGRPVHGPDFLMVRYKISLSGNQGEKFAYALMPFLIAPLCSGCAFGEAGLIAAASTAIPMNFSLGTMLQFNHMENENSLGHHLSPVFSIALRHGIVETVGAYVEWYYEGTTETTAASQMAFNVGMTFALIPIIQLDAGVNFGLNDATPAYNPFAGFSTKF